MTSPWSVEPSAIAGPGLFARNWAVKYGGLTVMTFHSKADAEYWIAAYTRDRCVCALPEQSCHVCRAAAARNEEHKRPAR